MSFCPLFLKKQSNLHKLQHFVSGDLFFGIQTLWAYNFQTVRSKNPKISLKNLKFIRDSVKQINKYAYRGKKPFVFPILSGKVGIFRREQRKMLFSNSRKNHYN
jgi:hypothetical protein